jgi:hypothetical protein
VIIFIRLFTPPLGDIQILFPGQRELSHSHSISLLKGSPTKGDIEIAYINTKDQLADIFTKPLDEQTFTRLRHELNILDSRNFY